tara:strand:- start:38224 stop:38424 length:201 start_codon:yes stop_codon:yes gene_type:complete
MKYWKPKSITWWGGVVPLVAGLILATEPLHGWLDLVSTINNMTGFIPAAILINSGAVAIGLRGAVA